jgi:hypothetical protein
MRSFSNTFRLVYSVSGVPFVKKVRVNGLSFALLKISPAFELTYFLQPAMLRAAPRQSTLRVLLIQAGELNSPEETGYDKSGYLLDERCGFG